MLAVPSLNVLDETLLKHSSLLEQADRWISLLTAIVPPEQGIALDLGVEAAISTTSVLNMYKKQVIMRLLKPKQKPLVSRYIEAQFKGHKSYMTLAYVLSIIKSSEVLIEMLATNYAGKKGKWTTVIGIETLKSTMRLIMLFVSKKVIPSSTPVHDVDMPAEDIKKLFIGAPQTKINHFDINMNCKDYRAQLSLPSKDDLTPSRNLLRDANFKHTLSEVIQIIRPVLYATLLYRYRTNKRNWTPWIVGLSMEFLSREMARSALRDTAFTTTLEREVYSSRDYDLLWWIFRGAMYNNKVRPMVHAARCLVDKIPILKMGTVFIDDYFYYLDEFYFSSATL